MSEMKRDEGCPLDRAVPRGRDVDKEAVLHLLQGRFPELLALYAFGSRVTGVATEESDLDLAILVDGQVDPLSLFHLAGELSELVGCDVDLVDFRTALIPHAKARRREGMGRRRGGSRTAPDPDQYAHPRMKSTHGRDLRAGCIWRMTALPLITQAPAG